MISICDFFLAQLCWFDYLIFYFLKETNWLFDFIDVLFSLIVVTCSFITFILLFLSELFISFLLWVFLDVILVELLIYWGSVCIFFAIILIDKLMYNFIFPF